MISFAMKPGKVENCPTNYKPWRGGGGLGDSAYEMAWDASHLV